MSESIQWKPYDPSWLVQLTKEQHPDKARLLKALAACTKGWQENEAYIYFVSPTEWKFETNISLHSPTEGLLILDILEKNIVGGLEITFNIGPQLTCLCGYIYDYSTKASQGWIVMSNNRYQEFREIERELATLDKEKDKEAMRALVKRKRALIERIYQCPECGRITWGKPGGKLLKRSPQKIPTNNMHDICKFPK